MYHLHSTDYKDATEKTNYFANGSTALILIVRSTSGQHVSDRELSVSEIIGFGP